MAARCGTHLVLSASDLGRPPHPHLPVFVVWHFLVWYESPSWLEMLSTPRGMGPPGGGFSRVCSPVVFGLFISSLLTSGSLLVVKVQGALESCPGQVSPLAGPVLVSSAIVAGVSTAPPPSCGSAPLRSDLGFVSFLSAFLYRLVAFVSTSCTSSRSL